jgi:tetratricopeptide (TPR) repeat protein
MKKAILLLSAGICFLNVNAQKKDAAAPAPAVNNNLHTVEPEEVIYNKAVKYGDYEAAKNAMYSLIQKHPENKSYLDSLVRLYFSLGAYPQCILAGTDFLQGADTGNTTIMELVAISNGSISRNKEALEMWDRLWKKTGNAQYAYQIAVNQYVLKRYGECAQTIDIILKDPAAEKEQVNISADQNKSQKVAMKAAANNLLGVIQKELSLPEKAKESFAAALKISPDFELAKSNLEAMNQKEEPKEEAKPKAPVKKK